MSYRVLTHTASAEACIRAALATQRDLMSDERRRRGTMKRRGTMISAARREGVSLSELAHAFGKSPEWVRQAEKKGQAS